ncbi:acyltransferase family protein [Frigoribacterium sp. Leaf172]|uniref:acyltransferase family protein n=1 Tax=Frigoribacterium sp. Leaf172 TaxID=1736285 RepID=UPI0009EAD53C|nr:acyltransferase family protein [Frigoribacterium sp. Leaf172]
MHIGPDASGGRPGGGGAGSTHPRRADIQGLRGIAVTAVVLYHLRVPGLSGGYIGVDVFFVVSGFLVAGNLLREHARAGRISLPRFWARRVSRLAPPALLVIAATTLAVAVWAPPLLWVPALRDAVSSTIGVANIAFARRGTDYLSTDSPSVLQHFWSLGVEEQFYVALPIVMAVTLAIAGRRRLTAVVGVATAASFVLCLWLVTVSQPWAFFTLPSRAWELGVGALLACLGTRAALPAGWVSRAGGWLGLGGILTAVALFDETTVFPGAATLVPVVGTALVLAAGSPRAIAPTPAASTGPSASTATALLARRPLTAVGDASYPLYLWHWPLLIVPAAALGRDLRPLELVGACLLTVALSVGTHLTLERQGIPRLARWRPRTSVLGGVVASAGVVALSATVLSTPVLSTDRPVGDPTVAEVLAGPVATRFVPRDMTPTLADVDGSLPALYDGDCHVDYDVDVSPGCTFGAPGGATTALVGDSHAVQWFSPLAARATRLGDELVTHTKRSCPVVDLDVEHPLGTGDFTDCREWGADVLSRLQADPVDTVVISHAVSGYRDLVAETGDFDADWEAALARFIDALPETSRVIVVGDTPRWPDPPAVCVSAHLDDVGACALPTSALVDPGAEDADRAGALAAGASWQATTDWMCTDLCSPVVWNHLAYRDTNHLTDEFAMRLAPRLDALLD